MLGLGAGGTIVTQASPPTGVTVPQLPNPLPAPVPASPSITAVALTGSGHLWVSLKLPPNTSGYTTVFAVPGTAGVRPLTGADYGSVVGVGGIALRHQW